MTSATRGTWAESHRSSKEAGSPCKENQEGLPRGGNICDPAGWVSAAWADEGLEAAATHSGGRWNKSVCLEVRLKGVVRRHTRNQAGTTGGRHDDPFASKAMKHVLRGQPSETSLGPVQVGLEGTLIQREREPPRGVSTLVQALEHAFGCEGPNTGDVDNGSSSVNHRVWTRGGGEGGGQSLGQRLLIETRRPMSIPSSRYKSRGHQAGSLSRYAPGGGGES